MSHLPSVTGAWFFPKELELEHTLFDQAWLPPSVARVSLRGCIVRRPFMETLRCSRKLFESFFVTALPGDRWRVTGEVHHRHRMRLLRSAAMLSMCR